MRPFELSLLLASTMLPIVLLTGLPKSKKHLAIAVFTFLAIIQLLLEGYRWQMLPCYAVAAISIGYHFTRQPPSKRGRWMTIAFGAFVLILLITAWALPIVLPVFKLPKPSGAYSVGTRYIKVESNRPEIITDNPGDLRSFMVKVWYPSSEIGVRMEPYLDEGNRLGFVAKYGLPEGTLKYLDCVATHTFLNASIATESFPVLIFSHGSYSEAYGYYTLMEEIVSHGYIVFNINHTYESSGSLFPEGEIKLYSSDFDQKTNGATMAEMAWIASEKYKNAQSEEEKYKAVDDIIRDYVAADISERLSEDIIDVLDRLENWNDSGFLAGHLDLHNIGAFGHSAGGSAVGSALVADQRIKAGINLDGAQWGPMIDTSFNQPFALISSPWPPERMNLNKYAYRNLDRSNFTDLTIRGTGHSNFMDIPLRINLPMVNEAGAIDPYLGYEMITEAALSFFNAHLKGEGEGINETASKYKEIEVNH